MRLFQHGAIASSSKFRFGETTTPPGPNSGWRFADATDVFYIPQVNLGDFIIDGPNIVSGGMYAIDMRISFGNDITLGPGKKIVIWGSPQTYDYIFLESNDVIGTALNPVVITNFGGQVKTKSFHVNGFQHWKHTGKYNVANKTGHSSYRGHDQSYANSRGTYGFRISKNWENTTGLNYIISGSTNANMANNYEIEYIEIGDGGGTGMNIKYDNPPIGKNVDMVGSIHDCYIHNVCEEGVYIGYNNNTNAHRINIKFYNNRMVNIGAELFQLGNAMNGCDIYNNVFMVGNTAWKSIIFGDFHNRGLQANVREGRVRFRNNILYCTSAYQIVASIAPGVGGLPDNPVSGNDFEIDNNIFYYARNLGIYVGPSAGDVITGLKIRGNYFYDYTFSFNEVYPAATNQNAIIDIANSDNPITITGNYYQSGKTFIRQGAANPNVTASGNVAVSSYVRPQFNNSGFAGDTTPPPATIWSATIGEAPGFPSSGTNKGQPNVFNTGDYCLYKSAHYRSRINNNAGNQPTEGVTDTFWEYIGYSADDFRLVTTDPYNYQGIGLLDNLTPVPPNILFDTVDAQAQMVDFADAPELNLAIEELGNNSANLMFDYNRNTLYNGARIVAIGSSTLYGAGATTPNKLNELLAAWVTANIPNGEFYFMAVSGYYSDRFLPDEDTAESDWNRNIEAALAMNPDILIISLPSNDIAFNTPQEFVDNLVTINNLCKARNCYCFVTTTQPRTNYSTGDQQLLVDSAQLILSALGDQAIEVMTELTQPGTIAAIKDEYHSGDGIHLNNAGHNYVNNRIVSGMDTFFQDRFVDYEISEASSESGPFSVIASGVTNHEFEVLRETSNTRYYRVRGRRADSSYSNYSNVVSIQQPFVGDVIETVQINTSAAANTETIPGWNQWLPSGDVPDTGESLTGLLDINGIDSGIDIEIISGFAGVGSSGGSAGVFPLNVIRSYWFWGDAETPELELSGLDDTYTYNVRFLFSRQASGARRFSAAVIGDRRVSYPANGTGASTSNNGVTADILSVRPSSGVLSIELKALPTATLGYLNAIIIEKLNKIDSVLFDAIDADAAAEDIIVQASPEVEGTVQINITGTVASGLEGWNDFNPSNGVDSGVLINTDAQTTPIVLNLTNIETGTINNGSSYGGGSLFPAQVIRYARYRSGTPNIVMTLKNLSQGKLYDITIMSSALNNNNVLRFTIGAESHDITVNNNLEQVAIFTDIVPDGSDQIVINVSKVSGSSGWSMVNGMIVSIKSPGAQNVIFDTIDSDAEAVDFSIPQALGNVVFDTVDADARVEDLNVQDELSPATITTDHNYINPGSTTYRAWVYQCEGYLNNSNNYPLIICLAGAGQVGGGTTVANIDDIWIPNIITLGDRPQNVLMISPHAAGLSSYGNTISYNGQAQQITKWAYDYMVANYRIDTNRVYVIGYSLGAAGCSLFAQLYPNLVAAIMPVSGSQPGSWNSSTGYPDFLNVAIWAHHGTSDPTQAPQNSIRFLQYMNPIGPRYYPLVSLYYNKNHGPGVYNDEVARRKSSTVSGTKAKFDYDRWFLKFSLDLTESCDGHVTYAEETLELVDYREALRLVNTLPSSSTKDALLARLIDVATAILTDKRIFAIDLGASGTTTSGDVNNITSNSNNSSISNLVDIEGNASTYGFTVVNQLSTFQPQKTFSDRMEGAYFGLPVSANQDGFTIAPTTTKTIRFTGLNNGRTYSVRIYGGQDNGDTLNQNNVVRMTIGATTIDQYVTFNTTQWQQIDGVSPSSGNIDITVSAPNTNMYACITIIELTENL